MIEAFLERLKGSSQEKAEIIYGGLTSVSRTYIIQNGPTTYESVYTILNITLGKYL